MIWNKGNFGVEEFSGDEGVKVTFDINEINLPLDNNDQQHMQLVASEYHLFPCNRLLSPGRDRIGLLQSDC